jgi:hypothetical protein
MKNAGSDGLMQTQYYEHQGSGSGFSSAYATQTGPTQSTDRALPYEPLPKRRGTGPTVLLVAVALVIPALIFGVSALAKGGDDSGSDPAATDSGQPQPVEPVDPEPVDPEPVDPEPVDPENTDPELTGPTVEGAGYVYAVPDGWDRRPDMARDFDLDAGDSVVSVPQPEYGFDTNVLVAASPGNGYANVEDARDDWTPQDGQVESLQPTTLDGAPAIGIRNETVSDGGRPIVQIGYLSLREGQLYSIVLSVQVQSEQASQAALDAVLASWSWADDAAAPETTA